MSEHVEEIHDELLQTSKPKEIYDELNYWYTALASVTIAFLWVLFLPLK